MPPRRPALLSPRQLRPLLLRPLTIAAAASTAATATSPPLSPTPFSEQNPHHHFPPTNSSFAAQSKLFFHYSPFSPNPFRFSLSKPFSSLPSEPSQQDQPDLLHIQSLSSELLKPHDDPDTSLPLHQRLDLSFSHISPSAPLILATLNTSPDAGRAALDFFKWLRSKRSQFDLNDEVLSYFVDYFGRRKDFKAIDEVLESAGKGLIGFQTYESLVDRLVRAGRPRQVVSLFEKMEADYGIKRNREALNLAVSKLCEHGFGACAEKMVKGLANEFFPDPYICDLLIKGWCIDGKLDEARRLAREMYRGGFRISVDGFNAILDCVCRLCRKKDPFLFDQEVDRILVDMDREGVPKTVETFNVLIDNLCKLRRTDDALSWFHRMGEWGCYPDATTFLVLTRSLYQAARVGEGDEMIDRMKSAGYGEALDKKAYFGFLRILCGIERIDHALSVFDMMKNSGCKPGVKTYELLVEKLWAHNRVEKANALSKEAVENGLQLEPNKVYKVDPRVLEKPKVVKKKQKKRLTLPEKMVLKRKKLRKLRLSYVKKPKKMMRKMF